MRTHVHAACMRTCVCVCAFWSIDRHSFNECFAPKGRCNTSPREAAPLGSSVFYREVSHQMQMSHLTAFHIRQCSTCSNPLRVLILIVWYCVVFALYDVILRCKYHYVRFNLDCDILMHVYTHVSVCRPEPPTRRCPCTVFGAVQTPQTPNFLFNPQGSALHEFLSCINAFHKHPLTNITRLANWIRALRLEAHSAGPPRQIILKIALVMLNLTNPQGNALYKHA